MALKDVTHAAVLKAMAEYDTLGKVAFLEKYGFSDAKLYYIEHNGRTYESKAIAGVAHQYVATGGSILPSSAFSGGMGSAVTRLRKLGFVVPDAPRNGPWSREELILALELYMRNPKSPPGKQSQEVGELAAVLDELGSITGATKTTTFRNENGVYMKMMNFRRFDPAFASEGKSGMTRGGHLEEVVWHEFASDLPTLKAAASAIRVAVKNPTVRAAVIAAAPDDDYEGHEGGFTHRLHRAYERDRKLIAAKKKVALSEHGTLSCEVCAFDFGATYGHLGAGFIEVHHKRPVFQMKPGEKTKLSDLALLCSNCHRMAHKSRQTISIEQLRAMLRSDAG